MGTQNINLTLPPFNSASWNQPLNSNFEIIDGVFGSTANIAIAGAQTFLRLEDTQSLRINLSGNQGPSNSVVLFPSGFGGSWIVSNNVATTGGKLYVGVAGGTRNPIEVAPGTSMLVFSDRNNLYTTDSGLLQALKVTGATETGSLKVAGETATGSLKATGTISTNGFLQCFDLDIDSSRDPAGGYATARWSAEGSPNAVHTLNNSGFFIMANEQDFAKQATLDLATGRFTATGGVGIGVSGPVAQALAAWCPSAVYRQDGNGDHPEITAINLEEVILKLVEEIAGLRSELAATKG
jgi:hypothetical protein